MRIKVETYIVKGPLGSYVMKIASLQGVRRRELVRVKRAKK